MSYMPGIFYAYNIMHMVREMQEKVRVAPVSRYCCRSKELSLVGIFYEYHIYSNICRQLLLCALCACGRQI